MDIAQIRLFVLATEKKNIGGAGRDLGLAPAVASARLSKLEQDLGVHLLHRSTRKVSLSQAGEEFLPFAREILAQDAAARAALGQSGTEATGTLRFAASSTFAQLYIVPLLPGFLRENPGVSLDLRLSDTPINFIDGSFDLALRSAPLEDSNLKGRKLANDPRILCAAPEYIREHGAPQSPADLTKHTLIAWRDKTPRRLLHGEDIVGVFDPKVAGCRLVVDDGFSQKLATMAGGGISLNSLWSVHRELMSGELVRVLPEVTVMDGAVLWLVYSNTSVLSPVVRVFIDFLVEKISKNPPWLEPIPTSSVVSVP